MSGVCSNIYIMSINLDKVLFTGTDGMLGKYVDFGIKTTRGSLDVTNLNQVLSVCREHKPEAIVHLAAETDMDKCERDPQHAYMINAIGTYHVAVAAKELGIKLIYISTVGVFDGSKKTPYVETDVPNPQNYYSRSKLLGELAIQGMLENYVIVRVAWIFGGGKEKDKKFVAKIIEQLGKDEIKAVVDQVGSPTFCKDLVGGIKEFLKNDVRGICHFANTGVCSRAEFAEEIVKIMGAQTKVTPIAMGDLETDAVRSHNQSLASEHTTGRSWQDSLKEYIDTEWKNTYA